MLRFLYSDLRHHITTKRPTSQILQFINLVGGTGSVVHNHQNPFLKSISNISESINQHSLTADYLVNSCGLPPEKASYAAKKYNLHSLEKAVSVISLFESYGFPKTHITEIISKQPNLLYLDPNKNLKPKLEFLSNLGASGTDFSKLFTTSPRLLTASLEKVLIPNISTLQVHGVPNYNIAKMLSIISRSLYHDSNCFKEIVEKVKNLGFNPLSPMFYIAVQTMSGLRKSVWDKKLMVYREFGLLEEEVISAFKKHPHCMRLSEEKIRNAMKFFLTKLKCKPTDILFRPTLLLFSLDKRIMPRCAVLKILYADGIIKKKLNLGTVLRMAERRFMEKYVIKYQETVPEVMNAYEGDIEFEGFGEAVDVKDMYVEAVIDHIPPVVTVI